MNFLKTSLHTHKQKILPKVEASNLETVLHRQPNGAAQRRTGKWAEKAKWKSQPSQFSYQAALLAFYWGFPYDFT